MKNDAIHKYAALVGVLAGVSAIALAFYIHSAQPKLGPSWHVAGILVTSPRLLAAMGVVMVIGGVLTLWSPAGGGLLVLVPAVIGLVYCYNHEWTRIPCSRSGRRRCSSPGSPASSRATRSPRTSRATTSRRTTATS